MSKKNIMNHTQPDRRHLNYLQEKLDGKQILIIGGTTGIGRTTALLLATNGARVVLFGRHEQELNDTLDDFKKAGLEDHVYGMLADSADKNDIKRVFKKIDKIFDTLDVLINNAGLAYDGIMKGGYDDWQYILDTNLLGYMACAHEAIQRMKEKGKGHIINIGSLSAESRGKDSSVYVATKAGIQGFTDSLRKEVNAMGIKVSLIEPGTVGTDMQPESPAKQRRMERKMTMLKAEDIANCILYILSQPERCDIVTVQLQQHLKED
jgi:NADP-dependent 3-hydroxy acid dehydrogenase YdfG